MHSSRRLIKVQINSKWSQTWPKLSRTHMDIHLREEIKEINQGLKCIWRDYHTLQEKLQLGKIKFEKFKPSRTSSNPMAKPPKYSTSSK